MAKRIVTKIGDIFCVELGNGYKSYFQYIANDMTQLNSSVIRAFVGRYPMDYKPDMAELVKSDVAFYAHTILKMGFVKNIDPDENFDGWHWNESSVFIGKMTAAIAKNAFDGSIVPWFVIIERIKYGYEMADFYLNRYLKQKPWSWVESYLTYFDRMTRLLYYFHFKGENICREVIQTADGKFINLSENEPAKDGYSIFKGTFGDISWCASHVTQEKFNTIWNKGESLW